MAMTYGGYLARVNTPQEFLLLKKTICTASWVGGLPSDDSAHWQWQDGVKIARGFWDKEQPRVDSKKRVALSGNGLRIANIEEKRRGFIIEWGK